MTWALMLAYGCPEYTRECLADLRWVDGIERTLVIVNPRAGDKTYEGLVGLGDPRIVPVRAHYNLGVARGWNAGLRFLFALGEREVLVTGNDAGIRADTLRRLQVAPVEAGCVFTAHTASYEDFVKDRCSQSVDGPRFDGSVDIGPVHLMRRWLFEALGGYDEKFWPCYWEDVDFAVRARRSYPRSLVTMPVPSLHRDGGSRWYKTDQKTNDAHHALFIRCRERFLRKWGSLVPGEQYALPFNGGPDTDGDWAKEPA